MCPDWCFAAALSAVFCTASVLRCGGFCVLRCRASVYSALHCAVKIYNHSSKTPVKPRVFPILSQSRTLCDIWKLTFFIYDFEGGYENHAKQQSKRYQPEQIPSEYLLPSGLRRSRRISFEPSCPRIFRAQPGRCRRNSKESLPVRRHRSPRKLFGNPPPRQQTYTHIAALGYSLQKQSSKEISPENAFLQ